MIQGYLIYFISYLISLITGSSVRHLDLRSPLSPTYQTKSQMASRRKRQSQKNKRNRPVRDDLIARSAAVNPDITANTDPNESLAAHIVEATATPEINPTNTPAPNSISLTTFPTAESLLGEPLYRCQNDPARYVLSQEVSAMELQLEPVLGLGLGFQVPATDDDDGDGDEFITGPLDPLSTTTTTTSSLFVPQSLAVDTQAEAEVDIDIDYNDDQQQQLSFPASPMDIIMSTATPPSYSSTPNLSALHATATGLRAADPYAEVGITPETRVGGRTSPLRDPSVAAVTAAGRRSTFLYSPFGQVDSRDSSRGTPTAVFQTEPQFQEQDLFGAASASFSASAQAQQQQQHNDDDDDIIYHATMAASSPIRRGSADNTDIYASMGFVGDLDEHINVHDGIPPLMTTTRRSSSLPPLSSSSSSGKSSSSVSRSGMGRSAAFARQGQGDRLARAPAEYKHSASPTPAIPCPGVLHPRTLSQKIRDERPLRRHCKIEFGEQAGQQASAAGINALARGKSLDEAREEAEGASQMHIDRMVKAARETDSFLKEFREQGSDYFLNGSERDENDMDVDVDVDESGNSGTRQWRQRLRKRYSDPDSDAKSERSLTLTDSLGELSLDSAQEALLAAESSAATTAAAGRASHSRKRTRSQASSSQSGSSMSISNGDGNGDGDNNDNGGSSRISTNSASTRRTRGRPSKVPKLIPADIEREIVAAGSAGMNDRMSGTTIPASKCMPGASVDFAALGGSCGDRSAKKAKVEAGAMDVDKISEKGVGEVKETEKKRKRGRPRKIVPDAMEVDASSEKVQKKKKKEKKKGSTTKTTAKDKKSKTSGEDKKKRHKKEPPPSSSSKPAGSKRKRSLSDPPPEISLSPYLTLPEQTDPSIEPTNGLPLTQDPAPLPSLSPIPEHPNSDDPPFDLTSLVWQDEEITGREQDPNYSSDDGFGLDGVGFEPPPARKAELKRKMRESIANYAKREQGAERAARRARRAGQGSESVGSGSGVKGKEKEGGSASASASGSGSGEKDGDDGDGSSCGSSGRKRVRFNPMKE